MKSPRRAPRRTAAPVLLALALALAGSCRSNPAAEVDPEAQLQLYRETALSHYENDDLPRAESQALKGLAIDGKDPQLRLLYGWINLRKGTTRDLLVVERLFDGLEKEKDDRITLGLAAAKERLGVVYRESAEAIESGLTYTDRPDPAERAVELRGQSDRSWEEAARLYGKVLEQKPENVQALNGMQRVEALRGEYAASLEWSDRLIDVTERELEGWEQQILLGDLSFEQENRLRRQSATTRDLWTTTHLFAADVRHDLGDFAEALRHLDAVLAVDPARAEAHGRRAQLLEAMGRPHEARDALHAYLKHSKLDYDHPDVRRAYDLLTELERQFASRP